MAAVVNSFALSGVDGYVVKIETDTIYSQPSVSIVGLGDASVKEAKERLEAAVVHIKYEFPKMKNTGLDFPDALSGSVLAARNTSGVLLVDNKNVTKQRELLNAKRITNIILFGGTDVVSNAIAQ